MFAVHESGCFALDHSIYRSPVAQFWKQTTLFREELDQGPIMEFGCGWPYFMFNPGCRASSHQLPDAGPGSKGWKRQAVLKISWNWKNSLWWFPIVIIYHHWISFIYTAIACEHAKAGQEYVFHLDYGKMTRLDTASYMVGMVSSINRYWGWDQIGSFADISCTTKRDLGCTPQLW